MEGNCFGDISQKRKAEKFSQLKAIVQQIKDFSNQSISILEVATQDLYNSIHQVYLSIAEEQRTMNEMIAKLEKDLEKTLQIPQLDKTNPLHSLFFKTDAEIDDYNSDCFELFSSLNEKRFKTKLVHFENLNKKLFKISKHLKTTLRNEKAANLYLKLQEEADGFWIKLQTKNFDIYSKE
mmetsp:Transcript_7816/g.11521  ORF Transcript_7816/g.11521 Transcript_7816/m.11521 type:complete len:180 (+) Transcript_7816:68-607(+)